MQNHKSINWASTTMNNTQQCNLKSEQPKMSANQPTTNGGHGQYASSWPSAYHQEAWERQWLTTDHRSAQQIDEPTTSSATMPSKDKKDGKKNSAINIEEGEMLSGMDIVESNCENGEAEEDKQMESKLEDKDNDGKAENEPSSSSTNLVSVERLIHTRELLEEVLCPWEKIQQFVRLCSIECLNLLHGRVGSFAYNCLVAFRVPNCSEEDDLNLVYIDEISRIRRGVVEFKHYGTLGIDSIQPHYGPIRDEDFERWLDKLISSGEELPTPRGKMVAKDLFCKFLANTISESILRRFQNHPTVLFDGIVQRIGERLLEPFTFDISPIILHPHHFHILLKLRQFDFASLMTGLCVQVKLSNIVHFMKMPPMMTLIDYMLIPISLITFDASKEYKVQHLPKDKYCNIMAHLKNKHGEVICSTCLPTEMKLYSQELIQISLAIWRMNNVRIPTFEEVIQQGQKLKRALGSAAIIKIAQRKGTLSGSSNRPMRLFENFKRNRRKRLAEIQRCEKWRRSEEAKEGRRRARSSASIGFEDDENGSKREIGRQNVQRQMPANFAEIVLKPSEFRNLRNKLSTREFGQLVKGLFVHVKISRDYELKIPEIKFSHKGHFILPIADLSYNRKKGRGYVKIHFPIKFVCKKTGSLLQKISNRKLQDGCEKHLIEECAIILNANEIALPSEEFVAKKARDIRILALKICKKKFKIPF